MFFEYYRIVLGTQAGQWRWRLKAANGKTIASGESYINQIDCITAINLVKATGALTPARLTLS